MNRDFENDINSKILFVDKNEDWAQLRKGSRTAFEKLYRTYFPALFDYASKLTRDEMVIEDAIQNLFITIWEKRQNLKETDNVKGYLLLSLKRSIFNKLKEQKKIISDSAEPSKDTTLEFSIEEELIELQINEENQKKLAKAFESLNARQKEIVYLRFHQNCDYEEIMEIMDLKYQSARNLLTRAIKSLKDAFIIFWILFLF